MDGRTRPVKARRRSRSTKVSSGHPFHDPDGWQPRPEYMKAAVKLVFALDEEGTETPETSIQPQRGPLLRKQ